MAIKSSKVNNYFKIINSHWLMCTQKNIAFSQFKTITEIALE